MPRAGIHALGWTRSRLFVREYSRAAFVLKFSHDSTDKERRNT